MRLKNVIKTMRKDKYPADIIHQFEHIVELYIIMKSRSESS